MLQNYERSNIILVILSGRYHGPPSHTSPLPDLIYRNGSFITYLQYSTQENNVCIGVKGRSYKSGATSILDPVTTRKAYKCVIDQDWPSISRV